MPRPKKKYSNSAQTASFSALLHEMKLSDDAADLRHMIWFLRRSERARLWVTRRFADEADVKAKFRAYLRGDPAADGIWHPRLQAEVCSEPKPTALNEGPYGGLTEAEVWSLIEQCHSGRADVMTFFLVRMWRNFAAEGRQPPVALWRATLEHWMAMVSSPDSRVLESVAKAISVLEDRPDRRLRTEEPEWRIHVLLHILDHPQERYRVGEIYDALPARFCRVGRSGNPQVDLSEVRSFCREIGLKRDTKAGRPAST